MTTLVNLNKDNMDQVRRAETYGEIFEALNDRPANPRADLIADEVERLGQGLSRPIGFSDQEDRDALAGIFMWLYYRLSGQDRKHPTRDAWVMHQHQLGAVMLHPTERGLTHIEGQFIAPNGTGRYRLTIERVVEEGE